VYQKRFLTDFHKIDENKNIDKIASIN